MPEVTVRRERNGNIAILTLFAPPVNALRRPLRRALLAELEAVHRDTSIEAVVITGERTFSGGADLAEFDTGEALAEPTLHLTITRVLDQLRVPSVAAISGVALGGGLELALACTARVAHPDARLGLPETTLGFMPGAGGTQRLPRAVGIEDALDLIVSGRTVDGQTGARMGIVDEVTPDPISRAVELATSLATVTPRRRLRDEPINEPLATALIDLARRSLRRGRPRPGALAALDALEAAAERPFDDGLAYELARFEQLAATPAARAARYRFLSERSGLRLARPAPQRVAVVGAGTMGRGIAAAFLSAHLPVTLIDADATRAAAGAEAVAASFERAVERGRITREEREARLSLLHSAASIAAVAGHDLVIEAVFEDLAIKRVLFAEIDAVADANAVLASNTSSLDLDAIASATSRPAAVVGMHFFSPADVMRLVEVVDGAATSSPTLDRAVGAAHALRKIPVVAGNGPGFIGNRIFDAYLRQANLLLAADCTPHHIDAVLESWGFAMGPFAVLDIIGNDVTAMARVARGDHDPAFAIADELARRGLLGRKTGGGWYRGESRETDAEVLALLPAAGAPIDDDEIVQRCLDALVAEAARVIGAGVAPDGRAVDTVFVHGYGFPADRGGPWFNAGLSGWDRVVARLTHRQKTTGDPFWEPDAVLLDLAEQVR